MYRHRFGNAAVVNTSRLELLGTELYDSLLQCAILGLFGIDIC